MTVIGRAGRACSPHSCTLTCECAHLYFAGLMAAQLGFFRVRRGINSMRIEDGDCWYADPDLSIEQDVEDGKYIGSMVGYIAWR